MSRNLSIALVVGLVLIVAGVAVFSWAAALIVAGVFVAGVAVSSEF